MKNLRYLSRHVYHKQSYEIEINHSPTYIYGVCGFDITHVYATIPSTNSPVYKLEYRIGDLALPSSYNGNLTLPYIVLQNFAGELTYTKPHQPPQEIPLQNISHIELRLKEIDGTYLPLDPNINIVVEITYYHEQPQIR